MMGFVRGSLIIGVKGVVEPLGEIRGLKNGLKIRSVARAFVACAPMDTESEAAMSDPFNIPLKFEVMERGQRPRIAP